MTPAEKLGEALELDRALDVLALAGIRLRHGRLPAREERLRLFSLRLGRETMIRAFGWDPGPARTGAGPDG
ncbi:hypothetical protein D3C83_216470 [compost metagenome]